MLQYTEVLGQEGKSMLINSLSSCDIELVTFKLTSRIDISNISCEITLRWMPQDLIDIVNISSGSGLVLSGNKLLPEPM